VDEDNKVRWRGCGRMMTGGANTDSNKNIDMNRYDEFDILTKCTEELITEL